MICSASFFSASSFLIDCFSFLLHPFSALLPPPLLLSSTMGCCGFETSLVVDAVRVEEMKLAGS